MIWKQIITLDSVDISDSITGEIEVEAEQSTARIASFNMMPPSGTVSAGDWLGVGVTIDFAELNSSGGIVSQTRIFTGIVDEALYNPQTRLTAFECTDDAQGKAEAQTQAELDALIVGSRYSESEFGEFENGWLHLENLLKTVPKAYDYNADGVTGTLCDYAAKSTADYTYTSNGIVDGSISYALAPRRHLFNESTITYQYRFTRLKHRAHDFTWDMGLAWSFCDDYIGNGHILPSREMIISAAAGAGWPLQGEVTTGQLPASGVVCGSVNWLITDETRAQLAISAEWTNVRRWTQEVTETYTLIVNAPQSKTWLGTVAVDKQGNSTTESETEGWTDSTETPAGRTDSQGDIVIDGYDRTLSDNDIETLIAIERVSILQAHRANYVEAMIPINPAIERYHTVSLTDNGISGQGKVSTVRHSMDTDSGEAYSTIQIAISLNGGEDAIIDTTIAAPTAPDTDPDITPPSTSTALPTHIGNDLGVPDYDEDWLGLTVSYNSFIGIPPNVPTAEQIYPFRFRVDTIDIDQEAIDHAEATATGTYSFDVPNETLTVTV